MMIAEAVLDTSAVVAAIREEPGGDLVEQVGQLSISAVNFAEVIHVLTRQGYDLTALEAAPLNVQPLDQTLALETGLLLQRTRSHGLSLGDCACLALGKRLKLPVLTADRIWAALDLGVEVVLIR